LKSLIISFLNVSKSTFCSKFCERLSDILLNIVLYKYNENR
jgi:hypothetical protein